jgi:hypothetical protein
MEAATRRSATTLAWARACVCVCAIVHAASPAFAQGTPAAPAAAPAREAGAAPSADSARRDRVLFLLPPALAPDDREALGEALMAQFSLGKAELFLALDANGTGTLGEHIASAAARAAEAQAAVVCWIDAEANGRWLVHMLDPAGDRLLVRPVDASGAHTSAGIETVAVMARDSTEALLSGDLPASALTKPAPPEPAPSPAGPAQAPTSHASRRHVRLSLAYLGYDFAEEVSWRHGASIGGAWITTTGLFAGAAYTLSAGARVKEPVLFEVNRPMSLLMFGGYRHRVGDFALDTALGISVDLLERHTPGQSGATRTGDTSRVEAAFSPRFRIEWAIAQALGIHLGGGIDVLFNNFSYISRGATDTELLRPLPARGVLEAGIAYYP